MARVAQPSRLVLYEEFPIAHLEGWATNCTMHSNQKSRRIIRRNCRLYVKGGVYFITGVTRERNPLFEDRKFVKLLRQILSNVKQLYPFTMKAYAFLPDHFHIMIKLGTSATISQIIQSFKQNFTWHYKRMGNIPGSTSITLWQPGSWDHVIRDEDDHKRHLDYIHYNPVKHGYVSKPEDFNNTSYMTYMKRGWYEIGWGHKEPESIRDMDFG